MWIELRSLLALSVLTAAPVASAHPGKASHQATTYPGTVLAIHAESDAPAYVVSGFIDVRLLLPDGSYENSVFETLLFPCRVQVGDSFVLSVDRTSQESQIICEKTHT